MKKILKEGKMSEKAKEALDILLAIPENERMTITKDRNQIISFRKGFNEFMEEQIELSGMDFKKSVEEISGIEVYRFYSDEKKDASNKKIIYIHGGCFVFGDASSYCSIPIQLLNYGGFELYSVNYSLSPEIIFPKALDELEEVYTGLLSKGISPENICVMGDSAGGNLACSLILKLKENAKPLPGCMVCFSPWTDLTEIPSTDLYVENEGKKEYFDPVVSAVSIVNSADLYIKNYDRENPLISPVFGEYDEFPPSLIIAGERELLYEDSEKLVNKMEKDGCDVEFLVYKNMWHVFAGDSTLPETKECMELLRSRLWLCF